MSTFFHVVTGLNAFLGVLFFVCYAYQFFYIVVPYLWHEKPHKEAVPHRFGIFISARNEEVVLGHLLDSINAQTYDRSLVTVFVCADNCTDRTAEVAKEHGAVVYERFNTEQVGKGYALDFLYEHIVKDYGKDAFDGFMVFDADNVLDKNYIEQMNRTFSDGYEIVTSYRNSKNFDDNWISAGYALWFLRESKYLNYPRYLLGSSCAVSGTGFLFSSEIIKEFGGWKFFLLTEDIEFTIANVTKGRKIGFAKKAHLYDEQPTKFSASWNQRLRWSKGYFQVWGKFGGKLLKGIFSKVGWSCYDMCMTIMPAIIITVGLCFVTLVGGVVSLFTGGPGQLLAILGSFGQALGAGYVSLLIMGGVTVITEYKNIHCKPIKKFLYWLTFPLFMYTYIPITLTALFKKVEWTPIAHDRVKSVDDICSDNEENLCETGEMDKVQEP